MTTTLLILLIASTIAQTLYIRKITKNLFAVQHYRKATEWTGDITDQEFSDVDLTTEVLEVLTDICYNPENWSSGGHTIDSTKTKTKIWTANDINNRRFYKGPYAHIKISAIDQYAMEIVCRNHLEWQEKTRKIVDQSELLNAKHQILTGEANNH